MIVGPLASLGPSSPLVLCPSEPVRPLLDSRGEGVYMQVPRGTPRSSRSSYLLGKAEKAQGGEIEHVGDPYHLPQGLVILHLIPTLRTISGRRELAAGVGAVGVGLGPASGKEQIKV